jgi:hypothetical protein
MNPKVEQSPFNMRAINNNGTISVNTNKIIDKEFIYKGINNKFFLLNILKININEIVPNILPE